MLKVRVSGDSGKSSVLDAIDFCLGARRNLQFTDADFHELNVEAPINISITIGELDDALKSMETYGLFLRAFDEASGAIYDEPDRSAETVLTLNLSVGSDLEPLWALVSERARAQDQTRNLAWSDRARLAPTRIGALADYNLGWRRGSVLNKLSEARPEASGALLLAARQARSAFGAEAASELGETLAIVTETAADLGIPVGDEVKAMLDAHSISFSGGTIALHDGDGVPLRGLGVGSIRLLVAGLQRKAAKHSTIIIIDELEHGLEPHRITRLLTSLGAKERTPPLQAFVSSHSPVALRELSGSQLFVLRRLQGTHEVRLVGDSDGMQSTARLFPEALLAPSVIVCEGASEVGFIRGLDRYLSSNEVASISALGVALVDCGGGEPERVFRRATSFRTLGYRVAILRDSDAQPAEGITEAFAEDGGKVFAWRDARALEDEIFLSLSSVGVGKLVERAIEMHGQHVVNEHIRSASQGGRDLETIQEELSLGSVSSESRTVLSKAARARRKAGWFKSISAMEDVANDIVGPELRVADNGFRELVEDIFRWSRDAECRG